MLSYLRRHMNEAVLVVLNMSDARQTVSFDLGARGFGGYPPRLVLASVPATGFRLSEMTLAPFGAYLAKIAK